MYTPSVQEVQGIIAVLHNITAAQFLKQLGQPLANHLLDLIVLVILIVLIVLVLSAVLLTIVLSRISSAIVLRMLWWRRHLVHGAALQINVDPALVLLSLVLKPQFAADLLDTGFDFLDMIARVIALADDDMEMVFASASGGFDAFLQHVLCFLDEEAVQIDCVALDAPVRVVLAEDVVARLPVVLLHFGGVLFSFL